jgi:putative flippase GtrA
VLVAEPVVHTIDLPTPVQGGFQDDPYRRCVVARRMWNFYETFQHLIHEIAKFGVVGVVAYVITIALTNTFHFGAGLGPLTSVGLATIVAATFSYFANRHWTWRHRDNTGIRRELPLFLLLSAAGLAITEIPVGVSEYALDLHSKLAYNVSANLIGTAFGTVWRFWSFRRWVFLDAEPERSVEAAHEALV